MIKHHLRNFFIPHEGNNYHPHMLHTKRAVFYASFFSLLKAALIAFAVLIPTQVFVMPDVLANEAQKIVEYTNQLRASQGVATVVGNVKLYTSAQYKADDMADKQYFEHTGPDGTSLKSWLTLADYEYTVAGENLAMGFFDAEEVMHAWINSPTHYANLVDPDFKELGIGIETGEYDETPTAYMVQHFGTPDVATASAVAVSASVASHSVGESQTVLAEKEIVVPPTETMVTEGTRAPLETSHIEETVTDSSVTGVASSTSSGETREQVFLLTEQTPVFMYDKDQSTLSWSSYDGKTVLTGRAYIQGDVVSAYVEIPGYTIPLYATDEQYIWTGMVTTFETADTFFKPIMMPTIIIEKADGTIVADALPWHEVKVVEPTPFEKYTRAQTSLASFITLFDVSRMVYVFAIVFFTIALALKILIAYHKQHHHIVMQTVLLIALLVILFEI